jgi:hypothetical protein
MESRNLSSQAAAAAVAPLWAFYCFTTNKSNLLHIWMEK